MQKCSCLRRGTSARELMRTLSQDTKRTHIKTFSFQRAYGAGADKISKYLKVPKEDVEAWIKADDARYPGILKFNEKVASIVTGPR